MKIRFGEQEIEVESTGSPSKILETEEWIAYKQHYSWDKPPLQGYMVFLKHKDSNIYFAYALPLFKNISYTHNTITAKTAKGYNTEIKVSPHQDIPDEVVALNVKGNNIPAYNFVWISWGRPITGDEARICYPTWFESYELMSGIKNLTDKAVGGVIKDMGSFGVINNSEPMHYTMGKATSYNGPPLGNGAGVGAYRCPDSFPCPKTRKIPPKSNEYTQYLFATQARTRWR